MIVYPVDLSIEYWRRLPRHRRDGPIASRRNLGPYGDAENQNELKFDDGSMSQRQNGFVIGSNIALVLITYNHPGGAWRGVAEVPGVTDRVKPSCLRMQRVVAVRKKRNEYKASQNDHDDY